MCEVPSHSVFFSIVTPSLRDPATFFSFSFLPLSLVPDKKIDTILSTEHAVIRKRRAELAQR